LNPTQSITINQSSSSSGVATSAIELLYPCYFTLLYCSCCCSCDLLLLLLHPFNRPFSRTTWVSWHHKGKPLWILLEQEMMGWHWHQLDHMQIICTSLQTDNHR